MATEFFHLTHSTAVKAGAARKRIFHVRFTEYITEAPPQMQLQNIQPQQVYLPPDTLQVLHNSSAFARQPRHNIEGCIAMARDINEDADMDDLSPLPRDTVADRTRESTLIARAKSPGPFPIHGRDTTIKCLCPHDTPRLYKDVVPAGIQNGVLTWMHLPCKPYLSAMSAETKAKIPSILQSVQDAAETGDPDDLRELLSNTLGPTATAEQKRCIKHFTSTYRCDGPCRGSTEITEYFCCKKCCAWQHKPCMLFGEEKDCGAPVCNHCYMNFLVHRDEFVAWQKKRLAQAALEALKYIKNPENEPQAARLAFCRKFVAGFLYKNRATFVRFVIARRRVEQLLRISRNVRDNIQNATSRPPKSTEPTQTAATADQSPDTAEAGPSKRVRSKKVKRDSFKREPSTEADESSNIVRSRRQGSNAALQPPIEDDSDTIVVKRKGLKGRASTTRTSTTSKKKSDPRPSTVNPSKYKSSSRKRPVHDESEDESPQPPSPLQKKWQFSRTQMTLPARKTARNTGPTPRPEETEAEGDAWDDVDPDGEAKRAPVSRRGVQTSNRSALDAELARRILGARRTGQTNKGERAQKVELKGKGEQKETEEMWVDNEEPVSTRRDPTVGEGGDEEDGPAISCRCANTHPTQQDSFECGTCGTWQHLLCARRTASVLPECNFCSTRALSSDVSKATKTSASSEQLSGAYSTQPAKPKPKPNEDGKPKRSRPALSGPQQPPAMQATKVPLKVAQQAPLPPQAKQKAPEPRKVLPKAVSKAESTPARIIAPKSAAAIPRTPLTTEMKDEVHQLCSTILWRTYCEIPTLTDFDDEGANSEDGAAMSHPSTPPVNWLTEARARLTDMLEIFGPQQTQAYLSPVLSTFPRKKDNIIKTLREMAVEIVHRGAYKRLGKKALGVLAEILALEDKGKLWKG